MPIKNLTNLYRPVRQGCIHLGIKKTTSGGKKYPSEVDFFVMKGCPELVEFYGEDPQPDNPGGLHKELHISLPSAKFDRHFDDYLEKVFPQYLKRYKGKGGKGVLVCKGDGDRATCWDDNEGGMKSIPCPCPFFEKKECKKIGIFRFRIREIPSLNIYQITTSSFNSLINLNSFIRDLLEHCLVFNIDPSAAKLILRRSEQTVQRIDEGKQKTSTHHVLELDLDPKHYKSLDDLQGIKALPPKDDATRLPPPDESKDELFYPPSGFEPKTEDEADVSVELLQNDLSSILKEYKDLGFELTQKEDERLDKLYSNGEIKDYKTAKSYFQKKLDKVKADADTGTTSDDSKDQMSL